MKIIMPKNLTSKVSLILILGWVSAPASFAHTSLIGGTYFVSEGTTFSIGNSGASHFTFSWSSGDPYYGGESFSNLLDPSFQIMAGQQYTFTRGSGSHPFIITKDLPLSSSSTELSTTSYSVGSYEYRPTGSVAGNFISSPNGVDPIIWTPTTAELGDFYYACTVSGHNNMVGKITVVPEPSTLGLIVVGLSVLGLRRRSSPRN